MINHELEIPKGLELIVPSVPDEVAAVAASDAREDDAHSVPTMEQSGDIAEVRTHLLEDGRQVHLSTASFAILGYVRSQVCCEEGWIRKPGNTRGIVTDMANRIGGDSELAKTSLGLCAAQDMIELALLERRKGPILVNARVTSQGQKLHEELKDYYKPRLDWIDMSAYWNKIGFMVDELEYMHELLGEESSRELQALKDPANVNTDDIKDILDRLDRIMNVKAGQIDRALKRKRERARDTNWARTLLQA